LAGGRNPASQANHGPGPVKQGGSGERIHGPTQNSAFSWAISATWDPKSTPRTFARQNDILHFSGDRDFRVNRGGSRRVAYLMSFSFLAIVRDGLRKIDSTPVRCAGGECRIDLGEHYPRSGIIVSHGESSNSRGRPPLRPVAVRCQWVDVNFDVLVAIGGAHVDVDSLAIGLIDVKASHPRFISRSIIS
jgi:hypothetical protein